MFASRYFNPRYWASRYWPKVGGVPINTADSFYASIGSIDGSNTVSTGRIDPSGAASLGVMFDRYGSSGIIDGEGIANTGRIDPSGSASKGEI